MDFPFSDVMCVQTAAKHSDFTFNEPFSCIRVQHHSLDLYKLGAGAQVRPNAIFETKAVV